MVDINYTDLNMFDASGNLNITTIFTNSWFLGVLDIGFLFILFASALLMSRANFNFGQITSIMFAMSLGFATVSGSLLMWGIVILIAVITGLRMLQNILLRI
jgi:hypothetical protein